VLIALAVFLLGVAGIARVAGARVNAEEEEAEEAASSPEDEVKQYPEAVVDAPSEEAAEEEPSDLDATSGEDEEATDVAPWDEA